MNRTLYTLLVAAVAAGITLAISAACSKKCDCSNYGQNNTTLQSDGINDENNSSAAEGSANSGSGTSSGTHASGSKGTTTKEAAGNTKDQSVRKYGDAETGGNVYTVGGVEPASDPEGTRVTNTSSSGTTNGGGSAKASPGNPKTANGGSKKN